MSAPFRLVSLRVAVSLRECSVCQDTAPVEIQEAQGARTAALQGLKVPEGADLVLRAWCEPEGWRTVDLPSGERVNVCPACGAEFARSVDTLIESLKKIAAAKQRNRR